MLKHIENDMVSGVKIGLTKVSFPEGSIKHVVPKLYNDLLTISKQVPV